MPRRTHTSARRADEGRRRWVLPLLLVVAVVGLIGAAGVVRLARIASRLESAEDLVDRAAVDLEDGRLQDALDRLGNAQNILLRANEDLYGSPELDLVGAIPVVSHNLDAVKDSVGLGLQIVNGARLVLEAAEPLQSADGTLEVPLADGALPVDAILATQRELAGLASILPAAAEEPSDRFLIGPVRELRRRLFDLAVERRQQVSILSRSLVVASEMSGADGPHRYLIAVANTAEMRGSGGMILNYGILEGDGGDFELPTWGRIDEIALRRPIDPDAAGLPDDLVDRWFGFDITQRFRNATVGADFSVNAPLLEAMYRARTGDAVDGVIQIDPHGLAAILEGIGPVTVPGVGTATAENVVQFTLNGAYRQLPGIEERSDVLGDIAEATFRKLVDGDYDSLRPLATALVTATEGRHILMHATGDRLQSQLRYFSADGSLPDPAALDSVHLTVQNVSANKLDYYLRSELALTGERLPGEVGELSAKVTLRNTAPADALTPRYIFGPNLPNQVAGEYRGIVSLYLPAGASLTRVSGTRLADPPVVLTEAGRSVIGFSVAVRAGESVTVELQLNLPPLSGSDDYELFLVPAPRVLPTRVVVSIDTGDEDVRGEVPLTRSWRLLPGRRPVPVALVE